MRYLAGSVLFRRSLAIALATSLVSGAASADAPQVEDDPVELIRQGRHLEAANAFEVQFERTGDAALLFAKATALRRGVDCRGAIEALERFIETGPPEPDVAAARDVIAVCTEILGDDAAPRVTPPVPVVSQAPDLPPTEAPAPPSPWPRDVPGAALLGSGVAVAVGGIVLVGLGVARTQSRDESEAGFERRAQSVRTLATVGGSLVAVGAALLIGSVVRYAVVARRSRKTVRLR